MRIGRRESAEATCAEIEIGDCWIMLGGLYHAGGGNITQSERKDSTWAVLHEGFSEAEGEYPSRELEPGGVLKWSPEAPKEMGYTLSSPNIGYVEFRTPFDHMRGSREGEFGDFDPSREKD